MAVSDGLLKLLGEGTRLYDSNDKGDQVLIAVFHAGEWSDPEGEAQKWLDKGRRYGTSTGEELHSGSIKFPALGNKLGMYGYTVIAYLAGYDLLMSDEAKEVALAFHLEVNLEVNAE